ncbi:MAG: FecR domain-containing protein [Syntrophaceae bacterium]|nr:FecR domain-containing protein [Syntrophaceae bacterium]
MNRAGIRCLIAVIFFMQVFIPASVSAAPQLGRFILVNGEVTLSRTGVMSRPETGTGVEEGDVIQTGKNASVKVMLADDTVITVDRNSRVVMKKFVLRSGIRSAKIYVEYGKIAADVKRFIGGKNTFDLEGPTAVAGMIGTMIEFAVVIGADGVPTTTVTCLSGSVFVTTAEGSVTLAAGQTAVAVASAAPAITTAATAAAAAGAAGGTAATITVGAGTIAAGVAIAVAVAALAVAAAGGGGGGSNALAVPVHATTTHH